MTGIDIRLRLFLVVHVGKYIQSILSLESYRNFVSRACLSLEYGYWCYWLIMLVHFLWAKCSCLNFEYIQLDYVPSLELLPLQNLCTQRTCWAEFQRQNRASKKLRRCKQMRNLTTSGTGIASLFVSVVCFCFGFGFLFAWNDVEEEEWWRSHPL